MSSLRIWHEAEEGYLKQLHDIALRLSQRYMGLYKITHKKQTRLRLPTIIMSSFSGVASFGSTSFPQKAQKYVSIVVGVINITTAMIQTYESYLKISDIVSKSLAVSNALKKLADAIFCELFIPVCDRTDDGIVFLRDCVNQYQVIIEQAPPFMEEKSEEEAEGKALNKKIMEAIRVRDSRMREERVEFGRTFRPTIPDDRMLPGEHVFQQQLETRVVIDNESRHS